MKPTLLIIGGPNGSGKTTIAEFLLKTKSITKFINADSIAKGISSGESGVGNIEAGRVMLESLHRSIKNGENVAFETTLSGRMWLNIIKLAKSQNYDVYICYVTVSSPEIAIERVKSRTLEGGHSVPLKDITRRYYRSLNLFLNTYRSQVNGWYLFDNSETSAKLLALKENGDAENIFDRDIYDRFITTTRKNS